MKPTTRVCTTGLILSLSASVFATGSMTPEQKWIENGPGNNRGNGWNVYYAGGVFNGVFYTGQLSLGPLAYSRIQGDSTAMLHQFDLSLVEPLYDGLNTNGARSSVVIGDYLFFNRTAKVYPLLPRLNRLNSDWTNNVAYDLGNNGGDVAPEGLATDGISLFTTQHTSKNVIRKYSITNQANSFTLTKTMEATITEASTFRGISYFDGMIYVVDNGGTKGIYEINASTGAYRRLGTYSATQAYQTVRYHAKLFVVGQDGMLVVYNFAGGTLDAGITYDLGLVQLYGIGVIGTGNNVTGFWVTASQGKVAYYSFILCNRPFADADGDNDVDQNDFGALQACFNGDGGMLDGPQFSYPCTCFDTDNTGSVNASDLTAFGFCATGAAIPWAATQECP